MRIIYPDKISYEKRLTKADLKTLKERRVENFTKFTKKVEGSERFSEDWLTKKTQERATRNPEKYIVPFARWNCYKYGHLNQIRNKLNEAWASAL